MARKSDILHEVGEFAEDVAEFAVNAVINGVVKKYLGPDGIAMIDEPEDKDFLERLLAAGWKAIRD